MPTEVKFFGVYGAVWLAIFVVGASVVFARRMFHLIRILARGRKKTASIASTCGC